MFPVHQYTVCSFRPEHKPPEGNPSQLPMPVPAAASGESLCSRSPQLQPPGTEKGQALTTQRWQLTAPPAPTLGQMLPWRKNWSPPARHTQQFSVSSAVAYPELLASLVPTCPPRAWPPLASSGWGRGQAHQGLPLHWPSKSKEKQGSPTRVGDLCHAGPGCWESTEVVCTGLASQ